MSAFGFPPPNDPGLPLPVGAAQVWSAQASASTPTLWLDTYYDSAIFANKSAAIQAAYVAAAAQRAVLECQAARIYSLDTAPLKLNPATPITIEGHNARLLANWGKPRCVDFTRTADDQTWNDVDVRDLWFDANNLVSATSESIVGNVVGGGGAATFQRTNFQRIYFRRCKWVNVPVGAAGGAAYSCFNLVSSQATGIEAQNNITEIHLEQAYMRGGNYGASVIGTSTGGTIAVNVYHDQIYLDFNWDSGVVPSATFIQGGNQIASLGWGDYCEVRVISANAGDVGLEIDGMQTAHVWGRITDSYTADFFGRNFHAPPDLISQRYIYHGCEARVINIDPVNSLSAGFLASHTSLPNPGFGEMVLEDCKFYSASPHLRQNGTALCALQGALVNAITIVGQFTASYPNVNDAPGVSTVPTPIFIAPGSSIFTFGGGGNIRVIYAGTGGANLKPRSILLWPQAGCSMVLDLGRIAIGSSLTGVPAGGTRGLLVGFTAGGSIRGRVRWLGWESFSGGDTTPQLYPPQPSTAITIDGRLVIDEIDLRKDPAASPAIVNAGNAVDTTNRALLPVRSANLPTYPIPSAAISAANFATAAFTTGVGNQYIGALPAEIQFTGGVAVTAIDASKDGTTYENVWTQASGALSNSVVVPVENGDFIRITFATTQPIGRVRFRRAQ